jgi:hypothetical protein
MTYLPEALVRLMEAACICKIILPAQGWPVGHISVLSLDVIVKDVRARIQVCGDGMLWPRYLCSELGCYSSDSSV